MNITSILRPLFSRRVSQWERRAPLTEQVQRRQLEWLLGKGTRTFVGERYGFGEIRTYEDFAARVPVTGYDHVRPLVERMIAGERSVLWPGVCTHFAQSSGTSDGKSKYIPVTRESFHVNHYRGAFDSVAHYLRRNPASRMFSGKGFILGGSYANELNLRPGVKVGDLSANLIDRISPLANLMRVPGKEIALMTDWSQKLPALVEAASRCNVTNISGVPSWFLTVLKETLRYTGASCIHDVWPGLEVFFHGGISMSPYRRQYARIIDPSRMHYVETYNASEGFFGVQTDPDDPAMALITDIGVFYEFVPLDQVDEPHPDALPAWKVEPGCTYELIITACNGLWRYAIGDTVKVMSVNPLKIMIAGRTKHYINAFGEELMVYNAEDAMTRTCSELGCEVANYTAAPVYAGDNTSGYHQWLVEFASEPKSLDEFARVLDTNLQQVNSDYQAKRSGNIFLAPPQVEKGRHGIFNAWLATTGKLGGQRKVPRLCNDRRFIDPMLALNSAL